MPGTGVGAGVPDFKGSPPTEGEGRCVAGRGAQGKWAVSKDYR